MRNELGRRELMRSASVAVVAGAIAANAAPAKVAKSQMCLFTKPLGGRKVSELPPVLDALQISALDLTCRPGGHVVPERAADDLPKAVETLKAAGISVLMITTDITQATKGNAEDIIKTAASLGIRHAKIGYYRYGDKSPVLATLADVKSKVREVAALFKQYGVTAGYHNHSGRYVGTPIWDMWQIIQDLPADAIGSYFDLGHAAAEGGVGGWTIAVDLLASRMAMLAVKDMKWAKGAKGWAPAWGPLGEGMVPWKEGLARIKKTGFTGPISLHIEYPKEAGQKPGSESDQQTLENIRRDWSTLRRLLTDAAMI